MRYNITVKGENSNFPERVDMGFDSPEDLMAAIMKETDNSRLSFWADARFAISTKKISNNKCIPANCLKGNNASLVTAMLNSPRDGAQAAAQKLIDAKTELTANQTMDIPEDYLDGRFFCKKCLWEGKEDEKANGRCPECGGKKFM